MTTEWDDQTKVGLSPLIRGGSMMQGNPFLLVFEYVDGYVFDLGSVDVVLHSTASRNLPDGKRLPSNCLYTQYPANTAQEAAAGLLVLCASFRDRLKYFYCIGYNPVLGAAFPIS